MSNMRLEDFLESRGLKGNVDVERAFHDALQSLPLAALREHANLTQKEIASLLNKSQAAVSKFEGRGDFLLSTLFQYVKALRGQIDLSVRVGTAAFTLAPIDDEGEVYFKLMQKASLSCAPTEARQHEVGVLRSMTRPSEKRGAPRRTTTTWLSDFSQSGHYTSASEMITQLAANDETQSIAA
ncbi:helix-turn-helix domain-containing protein [Xanthomonas citri]|uniref:helix-turn-helix domain-containing protein n=1 Tax=Xanthomonas citri TaxID=346 RepID=UPI001C03BB0D|nr:helix-turn-helix transcriptional regulator [Xanthomonas citri]QWN07034.1 hypothetical protein DGN11_05860 [Xanthomonas citri pv. fuscans]